MDQDDKKVSQIVSEGLSRQSPLLTEEPSTNNFQEQKNVQYVISQSSLDGLSGWLGLFLVFAVLGGLGNLSAFITMLAHGNIENSTVFINLIMTPLVGICSLAFVVMAAMRKKIAIMFAYAMILLSALHTAMSMFTKKGDPASVATSVLFIVVIWGICILYFYTSKRVKATLYK